MIGNAIANFFHEIMYNMLKGIAEICNTIISLMRMLLGMSAVKDGNNSNLMLSTVFSDAAFYAFLAVVAIAVITTFVFAIIRIIKNNVSDDKDDGAISKGKAWKEILRSALTISIIPIFVFTLIMAITGVGQALDKATSNSVVSDYGAEIVFSTVDRETLTEEGRKHYDAIAENYKIYILRNGEASTSDVVSPADLMQITGMSAIKYLWSGADYYNETGTKQVNTYGKDYDKFCELVKIDDYMGNFFLPLLGGCVMVVSLGLAIIVVAQRLFYCAFLFIISPFIVSTRPLDDGARWKKWIEIFISKLIGAYGIIICLNVFFLLSGYLTSITYFSSGLYNGIAKIVIYISGVIAAAGARQLIAQLIGADAGQAERDNMQNNFRNVALGGHLAGSLARGAGRMAGKAGDFFGGKKPSTLYNSLGSGGSGGGALASTLAADGSAAPQRGLQGTSMAEKIGNTLMGKNSAGDVAKTVGRNIADSRVGRVGKGIGVFTAGVFAAVPLAIKHKRDRGRQLKAAGVSKKDFKAMNPQQKKDTLAQGQKILNYRKAKEIVKNNRAKEMNDKK